MLILNLLFAPRYLGYKPRSDAATASITNPLPSFMGPESTVEPPAKRQKKTAIPAEDVPSPLVHDIPLPKSKD